MPIIHGGNVGYRLARYNRADVNAGKRFDATLRKAMKGPGRMTDDFSRNLRSICAEARSIAQVCREIGINRQQFNRYLNGAGMPSAHNLRRIARHFELSEADLFADHEVFIRNHVQSRERSESDSAQLMTAPFRDQATTLRPYLGFYHAHSQSPTWGGMIMLSLARLYEKDGYVICQTLERVKSVDGNIRQKSRYEGMAAQRDNGIYIVEHEQVRDGSIVETILTPSHRTQVKFLLGMTLGVAWRPHMCPFASRSIWKRVDEHVSARDALKACGVFPVDSRRINPFVRSYLTGQTETPGDDSTEDILM